ncbi:MAG TPA: tetratricopeptide repeat protein [Woeseiaceae bacterium]|nr:tetratricopeptide repeat protein [Woeseiaceae bacterium]
MLWFLFALMLAVAASFLLLPVYRLKTPRSATAVAIVVAAMALAPIVYLQIGSPTARDAQTTTPEVDEMVAGLAARLAENPQDLPGWKMLGRSYFTMGRLPEAITAFERAIELESGRDAQTLADLGEAILMQDQSSISGRAGQLFETALSLSPANPKALFYGGLAAISRGEPLLAADRWEALLATSTPKNVEDILRQRIAELRGESLPPVESPVLTDSSTVVTVNIALGVDASMAVAPDATVFIIARDPAQPSPPIAAVRRRASELPAVVTLSDADAMIPGRVPSAYAELEIVARVSMSGDPIAKSGDWFGSQILRDRSGDPLAILIDRRIP